MNIRFHRDKLRPDLDTLGYLVDVAMIVLIIVNLSLIIFDWLFSVTMVEQFLLRVVPDFANFYRTQIHADFQSIDLMFVSVYLTEFSVRWIVAIGRQTYDRWFFFPFVHWYDLLGCIPVGSFRWLRVLRIVSLLLRLQRRGVIDLRETWLGATLLKYYNILVEEVSDRVVLNVLTGVQREIRTGNPLVHRIEDQVLAPRKPQLVDYLGERVIHASRATHRQWRDPVGEYLGSLVTNAVMRTDSGQRLAAIPVAGPRTLALLSDTSRELGLAIADQLVEDMAAPENRDDLDQFLDSLIAELAGNRAALNSLVRDTLLDVLEQVKVQVAVQQWKEAAQPPD